MFELTEGQRELCDNVNRWYNNDFDQDYVYAGAAGTGKTSIVPVIIKELGLEPDEVLYVAYTGKAASVLMQKGFNASTIHSAFYELVEVPLIKNGAKVIRNGRPLMTQKFVPKKYISPKIKLIFIDEWSMVNEEFANTIYSFNVPILAAGDKYQLRPIYGESPFAQKIRFELTEITRQSKYSGIVMLATQIRKGESLPKFANYFNDVHVYPKKLLRDDHLLNTDIILTVKNKTRNYFNDRIRLLHGSLNWYPSVGDKLINRRNTWNRSLLGIPLVNGILGKCINPTILEDYELKDNIYRLDFQPDYAEGTDEYYEALACDKGFLRLPCGDKTIDPYNRGLKFEYAEAITVHLSQGSQYDKILYWDEFVGEDEYMQQIRYTAITRAIKSAYVFV